MTWTEQLIGAVEGSGAEAGKKAVAVEFLKAVGPIVEILGPSLLDGILRSAAAGSVSAVAESLDARQVATLLGTLEQEMEALAEKHAAEKAAWNAAIGQLQAAALGAVARLVISVL